MGRGTEEERAGGGERRRNNEIVGVFLGSASRLFYPRLPRFSLSDLFAFAPPRVVRNMFSRARLGPFSVAPRGGHARNSSPSANGVNIMMSAAFRCQPRTMGEVLIARKQRVFFPSSTIESPHFVPHALRRLVAPLVGCSRTPLLVHRAGGGFHRFHWPFRWVSRFAVIQTDGELVYRGLVWME